MSAKTYVALMRGINVGGRNKLPMKELVTIFDEAGCEDVRTYIQSGNVVYRATDKVARGVADPVSREIAERYGLTVPVVIRPGGEMEKIARGNPFLKTGVDPKAMHVAFLKDRPTRAQLEKLESDRSIPDVSHTAGSEIYLFCPNGLARTKLTTDYFDSRLETTTTIRNWNTVQRLLALAAD